MSAWRPARSLTRLFAQLDEAYPSRSHATDGTICDPDTHSPDSDHCPHDFPGWGDQIVTAGDYTHDPTHGADMAKVAEALRLSRDPRIKYVIHARRIFSATNSPWVWRTYTGTNPHVGHMHLSVVGDSRADDLREWSFRMTTPDPCLQLSTVVWTAPAGHPSGVPAGTRNTGQILAALDTRTALLTNGGHIDTLIKAQTNPLAEKLDEALARLAELEAGVFNPTDEQLQTIADRLATRLPSGGTFNLTPPEVTP